MNKKAKDLKRGDEFYIETDDYQGLARVLGVEVSAGRVLVDYQITSGDYTTFDPEDEVKVAEV